MVSVQLNKLHISCSNKTVDVVKHTFFSKSSNQISFTLVYTQKDKLLLSHPLIALPYQLFLSVLVIEYFMTKANVTL